MAVRSAQRQPFSYVWRDKANHAVGAGFRVSEQRGNSKVDANAMGGSVKWGPTGGGASVEVVKISVKSSTPNGKASASFSAQAMSARVKLGIEGDVTEVGRKHDGKGTFKSSTSGLAVYSAGAEAHLAKTTVSGSGKIGPAKVELSGTVGVGAAATGSLGVSKKGLAFGVEGGAGATVGVKLKVTWDTDDLDNAIVKASTPPPNPGICRPERPQPVYSPYETIMTME